MNNNMYNGYQTPQYYQNQFDNVMNQYKNMYGQMQIPNSTNGFVGQYINSYEDFLNYIKKRDWTIVIGRIEKWAQNL